MDRLSEVCARPIIRCHVPGGEGRFSRRAGGGVEGERSFWFGVGGPGVGKK